MTNGLASRAPAETPNQARLLLKLAGARLRAGSSDILSDLHWELRENQHWAVLGGNGAGKSSFLRLARGDLWPSGRREARTYHLSETPRVSPVGFREHTGLVSPELWGSYCVREWNLTGLEAVCTGFWNSVLLYQKPTLEQLDRAGRIMDRLDLSGLKKARLLEMSLGQARRVLIARALVHGPRVLFLDECGQGLDGDSRRKLHCLLESAAGQGTQIIQAAHRREDIFSGATHALILQGGRIIKQGPARLALDAYDKLSRRTRSGRVNIRPRSTPEDGGPLYRIRNVDVARGGRRVLHGINWTVRAGQSWAVLGANGSGKTTLLALLKGDRHPVVGGEIQRFGRGDPPDRRDIQRRTGYVSADLQARHCRAQTVLDTVITGLAGSIGLTRPPTREQRREGLDLLEQLDLSDLAARDIRTLSYGQTRLVLMARALMGPPEVLLLDEPLGGLDAGARRRALGIMEAWARGGGCLVYVTHHAEESPPSVSHVAVLQDGRMVFQGPRDGWRPSGSSPQGRTDASGQVGRRL